MGKQETFLIPINPEPWAIGPLSISRSGGKPHPFVGPNQQLVNYQNAVREYLTAGLENAPEPTDRECELRFFFWRRLDQYISPREMKHARHIADATNLQKGLEDALQKVLFVNDRQVRRVTSEVVEQSQYTLPGIIIIMKTPYQPSFIPELDRSTLQEFNELRKKSDSIDLDNLL